MVSQRQADDSSSAPSSSSALSMAEEEEVRVHTPVMDDHDEPTSVAFHEQPEEEEPTSSPSPAASSPPDASRSSISAVSNGTAQAPWPAASAAAVPPSAPLPTIKPVNILAASTSVIHTADGPPAPSASPRPAYLYTPTPTAASGRVSAYALSLLSSGSIFRSYKLNVASNQIEFQDIKLYAIFPPAIIAASSSHSAASAPPLPASSPSTPTASSPSAPSVATLYWGPPNTRTSLPSPHHMTLTSITDIFKGKKSLLFHSPSPLVALLSNSRCFSIASPEAALHLEALTEQIREEWINRIVEILRVIGGKRLELSHADEGEEEEVRREKERRERLQQLQQQQAQQSLLLQEQKTAGNHVGSDSQPEHSRSTNSSTLTPSRSESTLSLSQSSFLFRNMRVVTKERTAREKLEIQLDMRYTLREMVASAASYVLSHDRERVDSEEFTMTEKRVTSHLPSPEHPSSNFEYKAYAGPIFSRLRWHFDVSDASYLSSVAGESGYADFIANSKSGSFFFYTYDKAYMIKSMTKEESEFLRVSVLPSYYHHLMVYKDSLLIKIFGLYRLRKSSMSHPVYFMVMRNVFYTQKPIHLRFDLKGSTLGRSATEREKEQETPVLKDVDFIRGTVLNGQQLPPTYLKIGMKKRAVLGQLEVDVKYLERLSIMDYSLLVGVHYKDRARKEEEEERERGERERRKGRAGGRVRKLRERQNNYGTRKNEVVIPRDVMKKVQRKMQEEETGEREKEGKEQRERMLKRRATVVAGEEMKTVTTPSADNETKAAEEELSRTSVSSDDGDNSEAPSSPAQPTPVLPPHRPLLLRVSSSTFFTQDDGGLCSVDPVTGREGNEVYYLGIIDILQRYNARKKVEHNVKALTHDAAAVSCAPPHYYAQRFISSIGKRMLGVDDAVTWTGLTQHDRTDSMTLQEVVEKAGAEGGEGL